MKPSHPSPFRQPSVARRSTATKGGLAWRVISLLVLTANSCFAAATLDQQINPPEVNVGDEVTVTITVQNGTSKNLRLPHVEGLQLLGTSSMTNITFNNGSLSSATSFSFHLSPIRAGDFTIPAFDINLQDGGILHSHEMKLHVLGNANAPPATVAVPSPSNPPGVSPLPSFNPNGPVVLPPNNGAVAPDNSGNSADTTGPNINVPVEGDGRPAKVFVVITPETTDAYVGQSIPFRIEFFIRQDVAYDQDSLPTIKGSDFMMNSLSPRPRRDEPALMNEGYERETWITAIAAPKSGDFTLQMERDTYWIKSTTTTALDPFSNFVVRRPNLAHEPIASNQLTIHVHALPEEGRPANFTGAIGQLKVGGNAAPVSVAVGEPVTLHFGVSGEGNFDYVRCPTLADDPAWKSYVPSSKMDYQDASHTQGVKTFEQAVIPQKNGTLQLPQASFSYFDPNAKQYVTVPITLPAITVTGSALSSAPAAPSDAGASSPAVDPAQTPALLPNRVELGTLRSNLTPVYRQAWFWAVQGVLLFALGLGALVMIGRSRARPDAGRAERLQREASLHQEKDAMGEAARSGDAHAFFVAARHALQLQLGAQWGLRPEAITLGEIRRRDPRLAESLEPLFAQADEVIYSGLHADGGLDLAQWDRHVRELLQPQPARS